MEQKIGLGIWVQIFFGLLGLLMPALFWLVDYSSKELDVVIISSTALSPIRNSFVPGLELTLDGKSLDQPYMTVIEIINSGDLSIVAADFDSPLQLNTGGEAQIIRTELASVEPSSLKPDLDINGNLLILHPLLLNAGDKIRVNALTSGIKPIWKGEARIVGVSKINLTDFSAENDSHRKIIVRGIFGVMLLVIYANLLMKGLDGLRHGGFRLTDVMAAIVCGSAALILLEPIREAFEFSRLQALMIIVPIIAISYVFLRKDLVSRRGLFR